MKQLSLRYGVFIICFVLLLLYLITPSFIPWFPFLIVLAFLGLTVKSTIDGIRLKNALLQQVGIIEQKLRSELVQKVQGINRNQYERINKIALIEKRCSENQELKIWERHKRSYQLLPNSLLAIGLLGTFLGITMNLFLISRNTGGELQLQKALPDIIGSMAIAFVSSLAALAGSVFLTKFHPTYDLDLEKDKLLISLEDFLDNDYFISQNQPTVAEQIDVLIKTIDNYSKSLSGFVTTLPKNTQDFQNAVTSASNTLNTSANNFQVVANQSSQSMQTGANVLSNATNNLARLTTTFSDITSSLHNSTKSFDNAIDKLQIYADNLADIGNALVNNSTQTQSLIQTNQQSLNHVSDRLLQNANTLSATSQTFNNNISQVTASLTQHTGQVGNHNNRLQNLVGVIENATQSSNTNIGQVVSVLNQNSSLLGSQINQLQNIAESIDSNAQTMRQIQNNFSDLLSALAQLQKSKF
ncbi:methyl-accepting chemotaxis protein [Nostoc linckia FACHB-104]|nr:methyl-accepting chemotaxis protein [Nostoc linckia FACHB-104]